MMMINLKIKGIYFFIYGVMLAVHSPKTDFVQFKTCIVFSPPRIAFIVIVRPMRFRVCRDVRVLLLFFTLAI
jgi:hypothetical protein